MPAAPQSSTKPANALNLTFNGHSRQEPALLEPVWIVPVSSEPQGLPFPGLAQLAECGRSQPGFCTAQQQSLLCPSKIWAGCWSFLASNCSKKEGQALSAGPVS